MPIDLNFLGMQKEALCLESHIYTYVYGGFPELGWP